MTTSTTSVLRITRHSTTKEELEALQKAFGVVDVVENDLPYGDDPVAVVAEAVAECNASVLEAIGPFPIIRKLAKASLAGDLKVTLIRAQMERDRDGRMIFFGETDVRRGTPRLAYYEKVVGIDEEGELVTERL